MAASLFFLHLFQYAMAYQVLARKWRPRSFPEMVGQTHVLRVLINALDNQRLHHAYLFTGTRGVGKTTVARIFAKSLNCEKGVSASPCGECSACREIDAGRFVDMIEVDAASRTKVEDTRELLDNVQYAPSRGRYKVYLIDEVHMLSLSSFNALLKTLEEPPPHVKFLLATTDPQKLPATILSRCLQFSLKRLSPELIAGHLEYILAQENVAHDQLSSRLLAKAADGSMRDALSLLDQAIAFGGGQLSAADTGLMLGTLDHAAALELVQALSAHDAPGLLRRVAQVAEHNPDYLALLGEVLSLLQRLAIAQAVPATLDGAGAPGEEDAEALRALTQELSPEEIQLFYQIGLAGRRDLPLAPDSRGGFEMVMLRMLAFRPAASQAADAPARPVVAPAKPASPPQHVQAQEPSTAAPQNVPEDAWARMIHDCRLAGMDKVLAENCLLQSWDGQNLRLLLPPRHAALNSKGRQERLQQILEKHYATPINLSITLAEPLQESAQAATPAALQARARQDRQQAAVDAIESDPLVRELQETFDARLDRNSIRPLDE
jgi:DNA polymerase-3 subunit gamma/tau